MKNKKTNDKVDDQAHVEQLGLKTRNHEWSGLKHKILSGQA